MARSDGRDENRGGDGMDDGGWRRGGGETPGEVWLNHGADQMRPGTVANGPGVGNLNWAYLQRLMVLRRL